MQQRAENTDRWIFIFNFWVNNVGARSVAQQFGTAHAIIKTGIATRNTNERGRQLGRPLCLLSDHVHEETSGVEQATGAMNLRY